MKRAILVLNIIIGLVIGFLIWSFNQLAPGGAVYQDMVQVDSVRVAVVEFRDESAKLFDTYSLCRTRQTGCERLDSMTLEVQVSEKSKLAFVAMKPRLPSEAAKRFEEAARNQWHAAVAISEFVEENPNLDALYIGYQATLRSDLDAATGIMLKEIDGVQQDLRDKGRKRVRETQFMFILILLSIWAFSATFTEYMMSKKE